MPVVQVAYRHSSFTGQPEGLSPADVWRVAQRVRFQLSERRLGRCLSVEGVAERLAEIEVNGLSFEASWDLDHAVTNAAGKPVMGVTEYDKASPRCVMVSVNGPMLANADTLLRSTIAHELGHVVFDAPGWILVPPAEQVSSSFSSSPRTRDPRELRANEFMGALLVPPCTLRVDLQRKAKRQRWPASPRPSTVIPGAPAYDGRQLDRDAVEEIVFSLAEIYGVSESFMRVRLDRYDLLRTGRAWDGV
jgi:hypothetical protein